MPYSLGAKSRVRMKGFPPSASSEHRLLTPASYRSRCP